ncbi:hypothetical protein [Sorangium sp. So ce176]|uniref:hypothetical protein n=1 Tax=Sorangium sp. So ce176 TaxID=3133286 RepID=UPI003F600356
MAAPIVVELASGPAMDGELAALLVEACSRAAGGGGCALGPPQRTGTAVRALAVVWLDGPDHLRLRVDVASLGAPEGTLSSRQIEFRAEDPLPDRYRTAGLLVAALAAERAGAPAAPAAGAPAAPAPAGADPATDAEEASATEPPRPLGLFVGAGGLAGSGLDGGPARAGGWIMATALDWRSGFFGTLSVSYAATLREPAPGVSVQWLTLGGGGGLAAPIRPLDALVRARVEATVDAVTASAKDPKKPPEAGRGWALGTRTAVDLLWPADGDVALVGSAEALVRIHGTALEGPPKPRTTLPIGGFTGMLGLQLRLQ